MKKEILIKYKPTFLTIDKFIAAYNEPFIKGNDPKRLKSTTRAVAKECITLYGQQLTKLGQVIMPSIDQEKQIEQLDDFSANNPMIARRVNCSVRTVQYHIKKLLKAGFFINKKHHGPKQNYELRFNPTILRIKQFEDLEVIEKQIAKMVAAANSQNGITTFKEDNTQSLPPVHSSRYLNNKTNDFQDIVNKVSLCDDFYKKDTLTSNKRKGKNFKERVFGKPKKTEHQEKKQEQVACGGGGYLKTAKRSPVIDKFIKEAALNLWLLAYKLIYSEWVFAEKEKPELRSMLIDYFYQCQTIYQVNTHTKEYEKRLQMAGNYYKNHPGLNKLHPFKYFDPAYNKNGFVNTKSWYKNYIKDRVRRIRVNRLRDMIYTLGQKPELKIYSNYKKEVDKWGGATDLQKIFDAKTAKILNEKVS